VGAVFGHEGLNQVVAEGVGDGRGTRVDAELREQVRDVRADGARRDEEHLGHLRGGMARGEQLQHLDLALRQLDPAVRGSILRQRRGRNGSRRGVDRGRGFRGRFDQREVTSGSKRRFERRVTQPSTMNCPPEPSAELANRVRS
jgi:hypothetical protein